MSTSKDGGNVEGDLARASVEKENSSPPPRTMTLVAPHLTNPLIPSYWHRACHLVPIVQDVPPPSPPVSAIDALVSKDEGNVDGDSSTDNDNDDSPQNKKQAGTVDGADDHAHATATRGGRQGRHNKS